MASKVTHRIGMINRPEFNTLVTGYNEFVDAKQAVSVTALGAVGDGIVDDTAAFQAAIAAANKVGKLTTGGLQGFGGVVFIPVGIYKLTSSLNIPDGVSLQGQGARTSVLQFTLDASTDGVVFSDTVQYADTLFIRDLGIQATGTQNKVRDVLSLKFAGNVRVENVQILNAARYGIYLDDGIDCIFRDCVIGQCTSGGLYIADSSIGSVNTTTSLYNCYFSNIFAGPGANVTGTNVEFYSCIFESIGAGTDTTNGVGIRARSGRVSIYSCYFENNTWRDIEAGTVNTTALVIMNPGFITGPYTSAVKAGIYCDKVTSGAIIGFDFSVFSRGLYMTTNCSHLKILGNPNVSRPGNTTGIGGIEWQGGNLENYSGFLSLYDPAYGDAIIIGQQRISIGGGIPLSKSDTATKTWNAGTVADGAVASTTVTLTGAAFGDIAYAAYQSIGGQDVLLSAHVQGANTVRVTLMNKTGAPVTFSDGTLRVNILRYFPLFKQP